MTMQHEDFYIGLEFVGNGGFKWRCTDVGTRTISAICLFDRDPNFLVGPPYIVEEKVFDEKDIKSSALNFEDDIQNAMDDPHPGYPNDVMKIMTATWPENRKSKYPYMDIIKYERVDGNGEIYDPYTVTKVAGNWVIQTYLPFKNSFESFIDTDFIKLRIAERKDFIEQLQIKSLT
jgi:hypothetical protein